MMLIITQSIRNRNQYRTVSGYYEQSDVLKRLYQNDLHSLKQMNWQLDILLLFNKKFLLDSFITPAGLDLYSHTRQSHNLQKCNGIAGHTYMLIINTSRLVHLLTRTWAPTIGGFKYSKSIWKNPLFKDCIQLLSMFQKPRKTKAIT